jgi:hypothetical protein
MKLRGAEKLRYTGYELSKNSYFTKDIKNGCWLDLEMLGIELFSSVICSDAYLIDSFLS